jgi:hypothetical protein
MINATASRKVVKRAASPPEWRGAPGTFDLKKRDEERRRRIRILGVMTIIVIVPALHLACQNNSAMAFMPVNRNQDALDESVSFGAPPTHDGGYFPLVL